MPVGICSFTRLSSLSYALACALFALALFLALPCGIDRYALAQAQSSNPTETGQLQSLPPLTSQTTNGKYIVQLGWQPKSPLGIDKDTTFIISFFDKSGEPSKGVINYDFVVAGFDLSPIAEFYNQTTAGQSGVGKPHVVRFHNASAIQATVWVNSQNSTGAFESATFNMTVTPEFPTSLVTMGAGISAALASIVIYRQKWNSIHL